MDLTKQDIKDIKDFGKAAKIVHDYAIMLRGRLKEKGFNPDFVNENIESLAVGELNAEDFITILKEEIEG